LLQSPESGDSFSLLVGWRTGQRGKEEEKVKSSRRESGNLGGLSMKCVCKRTFYEGQQESTKATSNRQRGKGNEEKAIVEDNSKSA